MMKKHIIIGIGLCAAMAFSVPAVAQQNKTASSQTSGRNVTGVVVDENGEPIIGATITVAGHSQGGAITD